jgi:cytochrome P450
VEVPAHLLLHRSPARWEFYASAPPVFWSVELKSWLTADRDVILSILKDRDFVAIDFKTETKRLSRKLGVDLRATEILFDYVPLGQEGADHAALRKKMALYVSGQSKHALKDLAVFAKGKLDASCEQGTPFNIVSDVFHPCVSHLLTALGGVGVPQRDVSLPQIFDRTLSVNRRKRLNTEIETLLASRKSGLSPEQVALHTAAAVVGSDSILGTITESFVYEIERNSGKRMSEIAWSENPPITAVPYVDRIAARPSEVAGEPIEKGQRIRLYLDVFKMGDPRDHEYYFGSGRHACLGKALSMQAWQILTSAFGTIDKHVEIRTVSYRKSDYLFNSPNVVEVVAHHD